jgi:Dullard-like phosphatase family protein
MSRANSATDVKKVDDQPVEDDRGLFHVIQQLAALEGALWSILDGLKANATHVSFFCREYWGTSASQAQLSLEKLACNERLKRQVQQACVLESLSLGVASHLCSGIMQNVSVTIRSRLRNLLYYIHENCLVLLDMVCQRWLADNPNRWLDGEQFGHCPENLNLEILVRVKRYRRLRKGEHIMALRQHNEMITNVVRQLCRGALSKRQPLSSRSPGDRSPTRGTSVHNPQANLMTTVNEILSARTPLDRLRVGLIRSRMLHHLRFKALLNVDGSDPDCPWPEIDPYNRYGADSFQQDGPVIWFEPLPPMLPDLELNPTLPPCSFPDGYTLVLDLDETLIHYSELDGMGRYDIRPGMHEFVERMHSLGYEVVIFTAATQDYADWVIDQIDPEGLIHHRLYRQHALPWGPIFVKDLSRLGRDFDRTLIIDNVQENFMLQPHNGIFIMTWYDDPHDTALFGLTPLLDELITTRARVPEILNKYRDQIPSWAGFDEQFEQFDETGYSDINQSFPDENEVPRPLMVSSGSPIDRRQQGLHSAIGASAPSKGTYATRLQQASGTYAAQLQQAPGGMESAGGVRSKTSAALVDPDAPSPPSSPPVPIPHSSPAKSVHQAAPAVEYTRSSGSSLVVGSGPAVSSSYGGNSYLPAHSTSPSGYPQAARLVQAPAGVSTPQPRPATILRHSGTAPAAQLSNIGTQPSASALAQAQTQMHAPMATSMANHLAPQRAPPIRQVSIDQMAGALPMTRPAPAFSSVSGPYQAAPPHIQPARPAGAAMWGNPGMGPQQVQILNRR